MTISPWWTWRQLKLYGQTIMSSSSNDLDSVWTALTLMPVVNPMDYGAAGDGTADDLSELSATIAALPSTGGIVYLPDDKVFKKTDKLVITKSHVKFWSPNRGAEIFQSVLGQPADHQAIVFSSVTGGGMYGVKLRSDATARGAGVNNNQVSAQSSTTFEMVGCEVDGSSALGICMLTVNGAYVEGNYVHHTWADHIYHSDATLNSWCWNNWIYNEGPSRGDDGISIVTYGHTATRNSAIEVWQNKLLHSDWGRGFSCIGGDNVLIHHNWAIMAAAAGIVVASEPGFDSSASSNVTVNDNVVYRCGHTTGNAGILIAGDNVPAGALTNITCTNNVSFGVPNGPYVQAGLLSGVTSTGLSSAESSVPSPIPTSDDIAIADTTIMRTRDVSHAASDARTGLYRIHVRRNEADTGFEQRCEYVVKGTPDVVFAWCTAREAAGDYVSERRIISGVAYALALTSVPVQLASGMTAVTHGDMRIGDRSGVLTWLWNRCDTGNY